MNWQSSYTHNSTVTEVLQISHMRPLSRSPLSSRLYPQWQHFHNTVLVVPWKNNAHNRMEEIKPHLLKIKWSSLFCSRFSDKTALWTYKMYWLQEDSRDVIRIYWLCLLSCWIQFVIDYLVLLICLYSALKIFSVILDHWLLHIVFSNI